MKIYFNFCDVCGMCVGGVGEIILRKKVWWFLFCFVFVLVFFMLLTSKHYLFRSLLCNFSFLTSYFYQLIVRACGSDPK